VPRNRFANLVEKSGFGAESIGREAAAVARLLADCGQGGLVGAVFFNNLPKIYRNLLSTSK
jgi:hypothetical protein